MILSLGSSGGELRGRRVPATGSPRCVSGFTMIAFLGVTDRYFLLLLFVPDR